MSKKMLIDDTQPEETRVVVVDGNKIDDVEFESTFRKQIKGNVYLAKIMRIEPSLQAAFVDYGGNRHGFLAFSEIHPDYYHISAEQMAEYEKEVDTIIENKKQFIKEREAERARIREEKALRRAQRLAELAKAAEQQALQAEENTEPAQTEEQTEEKFEEPAPQVAETTVEQTKNAVAETSQIADSAEEEPKKPLRRQRRTRNSAKNKENSAENDSAQSSDSPAQPLSEENAESTKTMADSEGTEEPKITEEVSCEQAEAETSFH